MGKDQLAIIFRAVAVVAAIAAPALADDPLTFTARSRSGPDGEVTVRTVRWEARKTAVVICDMWARHWCASATRRVGELAPRVNELARSLRERGALVIHCPSGGLEHYAGSPQRELAAGAPPVKTEVPLRDWCALDPGRESPLPIDDSDNGCDCEPRCDTATPMDRRQIAAIEIAAGDAITESAEAFYLMRQRGIENVFITGVHVNMCVLGRPFAIRQLVTQGQNVVLVRDLTDSMYNPRRPPHVSHYRGTELVVEHIERHWCPTTTSADLLGGEPLRFAANAPFEKTFTYKTVEVKRAGEDGVERVAILADVTRPDDDVVRPVVLWIHGGACIMGSRKGIRRDFRARLVEAGYAVVSIDYRLAPETRLPGIYQDIRDAHAWLRREGPRLFRIDPDRIAVAGGSAGGFLTLSAGFLLDPAPRALVSFWGYGDVAGPWYSRPDPFYSRRPRVSREVAYAAVHREPVVLDSAGRPERGRFYLYCRQNGLWPREVTGHDPDLEPRAFDAFCPVRNVTGSYPPTLLIHGTRDTDVPYEQSVLMARELERAGVRHELITIEGGGHGFGGRPPLEVAGIHARVLQFLNAAGMDRPAPGKRGRP